VEPGNKFTFARNRKFIETAVMKLHGQDRRTIYVDKKDRTLVYTIDQRKLPFELEYFSLQTWQDAAYAIEEMVVRGAPLIGATAAFGLYLAACRYQAVPEVSLALAENRGDSKKWYQKEKHQNFASYMQHVEGKLLETRPTAINLKWALDEGKKVWMPLKDEPQKAADALLQFAETVCDKDVAICRQIGAYGLEIIRDIYKRTGKTVNILTHCNAGWLACIDWGTATAPVYMAHREGIPVHVWVDETRPRNQGARLTIFELMEEGVPCTLITDNAGGLLMQRGEVDMCIVGTDRTTMNGDVVNKIGTYLKALAANDNDVPFYVALPSTTIDRNPEMKGSDVPIENRHADEILNMEGLHQNSISSVLISVEHAQTFNPGFDVTPARLVKGLITEFGVIPANRASIEKLI